MRGDDAAALGHQGGEGRDDVAQAAQAAIGGDDADEVAHRLAEALLFQHRERGPGRLVHVDQRRFEQPAEVGAGVDELAQPLHLGHHGIERVLLVGVRVERRGVAVGQAAAGCDRRSAMTATCRSLCLGPRARRGREWETGRPTGARPLSAQRQFPVLAHHRRAEVAVRLRWPPGGSRPAGRSRAPRPARRWSIA